MCTLAVFVGVVPGHPLIVAANRDEFFARPAAPPMLLREELPRAFGGRDLVAGGTWLGMTEDGVVAGVLNRRSPTAPDPTRRSRGRLCLDLLGCRSAADAARRVSGEPAGRYNAFNLLVADPTAAFVATQGAGAVPCVTRLDAGLHVLTNLDLNDPRCPRIAASHRGFAAAGDALARDGDVDGFIARVQALLADHVTAAPSGSLCVHADGFGTRSASLLMVPTAGPSPTYLHADGPPCRTRLMPVALPF